MATYKTSELLNIIAQVADDGIPYLEIEECDDEGEKFIAITGEPSTYEGIEYGSIDACELPENYDDEGEDFKISSTDFCGVCFTLQEIFTIKHAVDNALKYSKECEKNPQYSKEDIRSIKADSIPIRNLQAKLIRYLKNLSVS